jgi:hypothetical protein
MSRLPCLLLFALAACGDPAHDTTAAAASSGPGSSSGPAETGGPPTTGSGDLTGTTDSTGGAEGGQTTGADPSSAGSTADDPATSSSSTGDAPPATRAPEIRRSSTSCSAWTSQDVSPSPGPFAGNNVYMGAYGAPYTRGPAQGVHDPIYARSFAIEGNGGGLVMSIVDLPGMGNQITREVRKQVAAMTGLSEAQVLVSTTHSHSAPDLHGPVGRRPRRLPRPGSSTRSRPRWPPPGLAREPGTLKVATEKAPANNRRGWGFTDDDMTILDAFDLDQQRIGTVVVFAAHPVVLGEDNKLISCDYPGYFVQDLEATLGAPVALFNGTLGDATPKVPQGDYADDFARAEAYGQLLASIAADITHRRGRAPSSNSATPSGCRPSTTCCSRPPRLLGILMFDFEMNGLDQKVTTQSTYFRLGVSAVQGVAFPGEPLTRLASPSRSRCRRRTSCSSATPATRSATSSPATSGRPARTTTTRRRVSMGKTAG